MRTVAAIVLAASATGCLSSSSFGSARTLAKGEVSHTLGLTMYAKQDDRNDTSVVPVPAPAYGIRVGMRPELDLGARVSLAGMMHIDAKWNPVRTSIVDLAIAPGVWGALYPTRSGRDESAIIVGADAPLIVDLNLGSALSIVPWGGPGYAFVPAYGDGSFVLRAGLGVHIRAIDGIVLAPEVATMIDPARGEPIDVAFGIGLGLGDQPSF